MEVKKYVNMGNFSLVTYERRYRSNLFDTNGFWIDRALELTVVWSRSGKVYDCPRGFAVVRAVKLFQWGTANARPQREIGL
jgi:hypothetical protein